MLEAVSAGIACGLVVTVLYVVGATNVACLSVFLPLTNWVVAAEAEETREELAYETGSRLAGSVLVE